MKYGREWLLTTWYYMDIRLFFAWLPCQFFQSLQFFSSSFHFPTLQTRLLSPPPPASLSFNIHVSTSCSLSVLKAYTQFSDALAYWYLRGQARIGSRGDETLIKFHDSQQFNFQTQTWKHECFKRLLGPNSWLLDSILCSDSKAGRERRSVYRSLRDCRNAVTMCFYPSSPHAHVTSAKEVTVFTCHWCRL